MQTRKYIPTRLVSQSNRYNYEGPDEILYASDIDFVAEDDKDEQLPPRDLLPDFTEKEEKGQLFLDRIGSIFETPITSPNAISGSDSEEVDDQEGCYNVVHCVCRICTKDGFSESMQ